jgi:hypothetical protein
MIASIVIQFIAWTMLMGELAVENKETVYLYIYIYFFISIFQINNKNIPHILKKRHYVYDIEDLIKDEKSVLVYIMKSIFY